MKAFFEGLKRWWLRRFRGIVKPPARHGGQGTTWYQHSKNDCGFTCACGTAYAFTEADKVIRFMEHVKDCPVQFEQHPRCACPVSDARYVKICTQCGRGHWQE